MSNLAVHRLWAPSRASFLIGGQWGSEAKGAAASWLADQLIRSDRTFDIVTTNAGAQAGHTSIHKGRKRVVFHLPTVPLIVQDEVGEFPGIVYLNAGSVIEPEVLEQELNMYHGRFAIHPNAAVITDECREAERKDDSAQTKIASTRKGVGEALARKVARSGMVAKDHPFLKQFVARLDMNLLMETNKSVLVEVPQGVSLSLNHSPFYPYTTSRDCTPMSAMSDAAIHPAFYGATMVVLRTFPIRVGNIVEDGKELGQSGACYPDQEEISWEALGVEAEITTVTKRVRRVFTFSTQQIIDTFRLCRPDVVFLSFCNYVKLPAMLTGIERSIDEAVAVLGIPQPILIKQWGPGSHEAGEEYDVAA